MNFPWSLLLLFFFTFGICQADSMKDSPDQSEVAGSSTKRVTFFPPKFLPCGMGDIKSIDTLFDFCSVIRSMALTPHQLVVKDVNETKWIEFNHCLSTVFNVDILIEQSSITYVNMTNLYSMQSKNFLIKNNENLKKVMIKASTEIIIGSLTIEGNPKLSSVAIELELDTSSTSLYPLRGMKAGIRIANNPSLESVEINCQALQTARAPLTDDTLVTDLIIENNPELKTIKLVKITWDGASLFWDIDINGEIKIANNPKLTSIEMPSIINIKTGKRLLVENNGALLVFNFSAEPQALIKIDGGVEIAKNDKLKTIDLGPVPEFTVPQLEIWNNPSLKEIKGDMEKLKSSKLTVRGNPNLPEETLAKLRQLGSSESDIQKVGEVPGPKPVAVTPPSEIASAGQLWPALLVFLIVVIYG